MSSTESSASRDAVVITGVGLITCLGLSAEETWRNVREGKCGIGAMPALESAVAGGDKPGGNGGQAPDLPADWMPESPREVRYLRRAVDEALSQSGMARAGEWAYRPERCGCVLGTTLHGMRQAGEYLRTGRYEPLCSFLASKTMAMSLAGLPVGGLGTTTCSACSSGLGAIALAATLLKSGEADLVIAGGYDPVSEYAYGGFDSMRLVAPGKLRPFCVGREGMKLAEGYAVVVLERGVDAMARGARVLAEVRGIGESADAHHLTQPHPDGDGALRAISGALKMGGVAADEIGLISAHATATPNNDAAEFAAFSRAFGDGLSRVPVAAFKSHLGHTLGAAGGAELILSLMAMRDQVAPATANVARADLEFAGLGIRERAEPAEIRATLNTSLGFGGANTCVVLTKPGRGRRGGFAGAREVLITGIGFVAPGLVGNEALAARLMLEEPGAARAGGLEESEYAHLINARRMRRMSAYSKLTLAATSLALVDAGIADVALFAESCSVILGTTHGSASFCDEYYRQIVEQGMGAANPVMFAEGVPNAASAQLSLMLGIKGCCQTIIGSRTAGIDALRLASLRIASGEWDRAIVGAAEENVDVLNSAYKHAGLRAAETPSAAFGDGRGFLTSCAAVTLVLESRASVESRQRARVWARVGRGAAAQGALESHGAAMLDRVVQDVGDPECLLASPNGTKLDRIEAAGLELADRRKGRRVSAIYGYLAETFSVGPLGALAGVCLTGRLPRLMAGNGARWAAESVRPVEGEFGVLATDYAGNVSGISVCRMGGLAGKMTSC